MQRLHKFHRRAVRTAADTFTPLAQHNEILLSQDRRTLSFQSHPELTDEIAQNLVQHATSYSDHDPTVDLEDIEAMHDGQHVWDRIVAWAEDLNQT